MSQTTEPTEELNLDSFRRRHAEWLATVPNGPLYCLPEKTILRLGQANPPQPSLLDRLAYRAEQDLFALCRRDSIVGFDGDRPIVYPYLVPPLPLPSRNKYPDLGWSDAQWQAVGLALNQTKLANERLAASAGWLATEPPFLDAVRHLAQRWKNIPEDLRPGFPLLRPTLVNQAPQGSIQAQEAVQAWTRDFVDFCERWGLVGMATWDLPSPQGPLLPSILPMNSPVLPAQGVCLILPIHYHLTGDHDLMKMILEHQQALAAQLGLDPTIAGLPHYKHYAQILKVVHYERTIRERYTTDRPPRGFVGTLIEALAEGLNQSSEQVIRLRREISQCQRGRRSQVKRLRLPKT